MVIDGGADGPSTDDTGKIAKAHGKVIYHSGVFKTMDGGWDMALQRNVGINKASGDVLFFLSADMLFENLEILIDAVKEEKYRIYFSSIIEFWLSTKFSRVYDASGDLLTTTAPILEPVALDRSLHPYSEETGRFNLDGACPEDRVILPQVRKFHLGWIRPFKEQVAKHIRHVKQHRWGEAGEKLLQGTERSLEQWAMLHVLSYPQVGSIRFYGEFPPAVESLKDMQYNDGVKDATNEFEERYGTSIFKMQRHKG